MKIKLIPLLSLLFACGAPDPEAEENVSPLWYTDPEGGPFRPEWAKDLIIPGQEGRIDGSPWIDGMFNRDTAKVAFCAEYPEAWFCSEAGQLEQAWRSSEYHGMGYGLQDGTCYGPDSPAGTGDCIFPEMKHQRIVDTYYSCYDLPSHPSGPSAVQEGGILAGIRAGILAWDNRGTNCGVANCTASDIVVNGTPGTSWYAPIKVDCDLDNDYAYAIGGADSLGKVRISNLPTGPHSGKDQDDARVAKDQRMSVNIRLIWEHATASCPGGINVSATYLSRFTESIGAHEQGHAMGFAHFHQGGSLAGNVMYPFRAPDVCVQAYTIPPEFDAAIGVWDTPSSGGVTIVDSNLENNLPY